MVLARLKRTQNAPQSEKEEANLDDEEHNDANQILRGAAREFAVFRNRNGRTAIRENRRARRQSARARVPERARACGS